MILKKITLATLALFFLQSAVAQTLVLDSVYCRINDFQTNTPQPQSWRKHLYDHQNRDTQETVYRYRAQKQAFEPNERFSKSYNSQGQLTEVVRHLHNGTNWYPEEQTVHTYTNSGKPETEVENFWNAGQWNPARKQTYTYDSNDSLVELLFQDYSNGQWANNRKTEFRFSGSQRSEILNYVFEGGTTLDTTDQALFTYNNGLLVKELFRYDDPGFDRVIDGSENTYTYSNGKVEVMKQRLYDPFNQAWMDLLVDSFSYPMTGYTKMVQYGNFGGWTPQLQSHRYSDGQGRDTLTLDDYWDFGTQTFVKGSRRKWEYNQKGHLVYEGEHTYSNSDNRWVLQSDCWYNYVERVTVGSAFAQETAQVQVWQNRYGAVVKSDKEMRSVKVYRVNGQLVGHHTQAGELLSLPHLPSGALMLFIQGDGWQTSQTVIIPEMK